MCPTRHHLYNIDTSTLYVSAAQPSWAMSHKHGSEIPWPKAKQNSIIIHDKNNTDILHPTYSDVSLPETGNMHQKQIQKQVKQ